MNLLTTQQVARLVGRNVRKVQRMVKAGELSPVLLPGRGYVFDAAEIERWQQRRAEARATAKQSSTRRPRPHRSGFARRAELPPDAALKLQELAERARQVNPRDDGRIWGATWERTLLDGYICRLCDAGWTYTAIGHVLGVSSEAIRVRYANAGEYHFYPGELPDVPSPRDARPRQVRKPQMKPEFVQWLQQTHAIARQCRGHHPPGSAERLASEGLWAAIHEATTQGITPMDIAKALGVTRAAINLGLGRHGYRKNPPSQKTYLGRPKLATVTNLSDRRAS